MIVGHRAGQYLSQWTRYRQVSRKTSGAAESYRFDRSPNLERVYMNLYGRKTRGETMKKSESNDESEHNSIWRAIERLQKRVRELEGEVEALQRGDNTGFRHENDGGYFD